MATLPEVTARLDADVSGFISGWEKAAAAAADVLGNNLMRMVVIPQPDPEVVSALAGTARRSANDAQQ